MRYRSPASGRPLAPDAPHSLAADGERWPVVDGIPYLRANSGGLVAVALDHLDAGRPDDALMRLLTDQDDWWAGPATDLGELERLVRERDTLSLREAMALLRMGPVADYFAYRWSDPTYLAGLALLEAHWAEPQTVFELACGIGHYLRELGSRGVQCTGADVVFAKCWLAKNWVAPLANYVVFDASAPWPIEGERFDLVMCHDAFYFLSDQPAMARRLRAATGPDGMLAVSHIHNSAFRNGSKGPAVEAAALTDMFPDAAIYDENELLWSLLESKSPSTTTFLISGEADQEIEAFSLVEGGAPEPRALSGGLAMPRTNARLRRNPLLGDDPDHDAVRWPSERYRDEYGSGCFWADGEDDLPFPFDPVRLRRLVDLPERW